MTSEIPEIKSKSVYIDESKSMDIETNFLIQDYIGFGGSSYTDTASRYMSINYNHRLVNVDKSE